MAFSVSEFKSNGIKKGGARSALFQVEIPHWPSISAKNPGSSVKFTIKGASIPTSTVGSYEVFYHGKGYKVAGDRTYDTWDTTIINDEDFLVRNALEDWMNLISNQKLNTRRKSVTGRKEGTDASYKKDLKLTQFGKDGVQLTHYHFVGAFPTNLSAIALDWATQDIQEFTCSWTYDYWFQETKHGGGGGSSYTTSGIDSGRTNTSSANNVPPSLRGN